MNTLKQLINIFLVLFCFLSCDKVDKPYTENFGKCGNGNLSIPIKKILLEDYTGHTCGNCPRAAEQTEFLIENYCDHIVPISVHVGFFAEPYPSGKYTYDFRTEVGNSFDSRFGNSASGLPNGMVNRMSYNGSQILPYEAWATAIEILLQTAPTIDIEIENNYSEETKKQLSSVKINFLKSQQVPLSLSVLLVEDSVINWQKDYDFIDPENAQNKDIENYIHRHVLRTAINANEGESIVSSSIEQGKSITKNYTFTLNDEWKANHCSIVAFVFNNESKEVIQAESMVLKVQ